MRPRGGLTEDQERFVATASTYELSLAGMAFPVSLHLLFNAVAAAALILLGHATVGLVAFAASSLFDYYQQGLMGRWRGTAAGGDEGKGFRRLAALCFVRHTIYLAGPVTTVLLEPQLDRGSI